MDTAVPSGVHAKMHAVMCDVTHIGKDRRVETDGPKYQYRGIDQIQAEVGHSARRHGLLILPTVTDTRHVRDEVTSEWNGKKKTILWTTAYVTVRYRFLDAATGTYEDITTAGEGRDNSDKATNKAMTMALKTALLQGLMIPVEGEEDPDATRPEVEHDHEPAPPAIPSMTPAEAAAKAHTSLQGIGKFPPAQRAAKLRALTAWVGSYNALTEPVDGGITIEAAINAALATLPDQAAQ